MEIEEMNVEIFEPDSVYATAHVEQSGTSDYVTIHNHGIKIRLTPEVLEKAIDELKAEQEAYKQYQAVKENGTD